ncbi:MAG: hypothetical protein FOGNACKC_06328 [Anaerolineae bacterium]|nr:hypothetical protein [Anaerolineae bacterium]
MTKISKPVVYLIISTFGACLFCGCFLALLGQFYGIDGPTVEAGQKQANKLLVALEQYKHDTGSYPSDLNLLVPTYLPALPRPAWRWPYEYELRAGGEEFVISFRVGRNMDGDYCEYNSQTKAWRCTDLI